MVKFWSKKDTKSKSDLKERKWRKGSDLKVVKKKPMIWGNTIPIQMTSCKDTK